MSIRVVSHTCTLVTRWNVFENSCLIYCTKLIQYLVIIIQHGIEVDMADLKTINQSLCTFSLVSLYLSFFVESLSNLSSIVWPKAYSTQNLVHVNKSIPPNNIMLTIAAPMVMKRIVAAP